MLTPTRIGAAFTPVRVQLIFIRHRSSLAADVQVEEHAVPYGDEYGAGPSRIPYQPPSTVYSQSLPPSRRSTRNAARQLRQNLSRVSHGAFANPQTFLNTILLPSSRSPLDLSPLERHAIIHHLLRVGKARLAVGIAVHFLELESEAGGKADLGQRRFAVRTLAAMSDRRRYRLPEVSYQKRDESETVVQPPIEEQRPQAPSSQLAMFIDLLERLRRVAHPRPEEFYTLVINQCLKEKRHDLAAKVYVGLVEEWILEGRIAEGADPEDFYHGGGPPRQARSSTYSSLHRLWFRGVRTWRLPGEALSPHDRLDLWHPYHVAGGERMRGFPMPNPTSPPSLVPHPAISLLLPILKALALDPTKASPAEYATSMRALAALANTILNRTLPIPAIPRLLQAFSQSHTIPAVYPDSFEDVPQDNAWAYTANTQVHVAMVSLMFSPPHFARIREIEQAQGVITEPSGREVATIADEIATRKYAIDRHLPEPAPGPAQYMLRPLGWQSCLVLVKYSLERLKQPRLLPRLLSYMQGTFKGWSTSAYNTLFRGASLARDNELAQQAEDALFGATMLGRSAPRRVESSEPVSVESVEISVVEPLPSTPAEPAPMPNAESLQILIAHLAATSQFDRLVQLVYALIPFLSVGRATSEQQSKRLAEATGTPTGFRGRPLPPDLTPQIYAELVSALAKAGRTGLAQRVYFLAISTEAKVAQRHDEVSPETPVPQSLRLPIHLFTAIVRAYAAEARNLNDNQAPAGWKVKEEYKRLPRRQAGEHMVWDLYLSARERWVYAYKPASGLPELSRTDRHGAQILKRNPTSRTPSAHLTGEQTLTPDARFYNAVIAGMSRRWALRSSEPLAPARRAELGLLLADLEQLGYDVPSGLAAKWAAAIEPGLNIEDPAFNPTSQKHLPIYLPIKSSQSLRAERPVRREAYVPARRAIEHGDTRGREESGEQWNDSRSAISSV